MIKVNEKKRNRMKKLLYILFFISLLINNIAFAESKLEKVKNKIKSCEYKLIGKKRK